MPRPFSRLRGRPRIAEQAHNCFVARLALGEAPMKDTHRASLIFAGIGAILAPAGPAGAQIVLSQPSFEAGERYAAFCRCETGCEGSATTALSVQIPDGVIVLDTPEKPGWTVSARRDKGQVAG